MYGQSESCGEGGVEVEESGGGDKEDRYGYDGFLCKDSLRKETIVEIILLNPLPFHYTNEKKRKMHLLLSIISLSILLLDSELVYVAGNLPLNFLH